MTGRIIKDLHGHTLKVLSWTVLISGKNMFPLIHKGEHCSLQTDTTSPDFNNFILAIYNDTYRMVMYSPNDFYILAELSLLKYNPKEDIRSIEYGKK